MFIHTVLFKIQPSQVNAYRNDSKMWARRAREAKGFVAYFTMKRINGKNEYASVYEWRSQSFHGRFMKKYHEELVAKSRAKVKVLGYFNLKTIDRLK